MRVRSRFNSNYEPVAVRFFNQGRTECTRPVNLDVVKFVEAYQNSIDEENTLSDSVKSNLKDMALSACGSHIERIKMCQKGQGIERHLTGLMAMYDIFGKELGIENKPKIFETDGYKLLKHDKISTSGLGYESVKVFGFGPVVEDGFGVGYSIKKDSISVCLSTKIPNREHFERIIKCFPKNVEILRNILK